MKNSSQSSWSTPPRISATGFWIACLMVLGACSSAPTQVVFTTPPQTLEVGTCSAVSVELRDGSNRHAVTGGEGRLTTPIGPSAIQFFSDSACSTRASFTLGLSLTFYMRGSQVVEGTITVPSLTHEGIPGLQSAVQQVKIVAPTGSGLSATWTNMNSTVSGNSLSAVWGRGPGDVWAVGNSGDVLHWNGSTTDRLPSGTTSDLNAVGGDGPGDIWAVGANGTIIRWNGTSWIQAVSGTTSSLFGVWAAGASSALAVGQDGTILQWRGTSWARVPNPTTTNATTTRLAGVWGSLLLVGQPEVVSLEGFAVGEGGVILSTSKPSGFSEEIVGRMSTGTMTSLAAISGASRGDIWAVGASGLIMHYGQGRWDDVYSGTTADLRAIWANTESDAWAVGSGGVVLHWNGRFWSPVATTLTANLTGVWGTDAGAVWVVSENGEMLRGP